MGKQAQGICDFVVVGKTGMRASLFEFRVQDPSHYFLLPAGDEESAVTPGDLYEACVPGNWPAATMPP